VNFDNRFIENINARWLKFESLDAILFQNGQPMEARYRQQA
jgi:hypothetical protein